MEINKNDLLTLTVTDLGKNGEGIGRVDGYTLFVKDAVIGDVAEVKIIKTKKKYGYARLERVITPSPFRIQPPCPCHRQCGGCQIQALSYEKQLDFKEEMVKNHLSRIGKLNRDMLDSIMEPILGMEEPFRYRNKAQFPFGTNGDGEIITGFYAGRTHDIISNTNCLLGAEINERILEIILDYMKKWGVSAYDEVSGTGLLRHVLIRVAFATGEIMVCLVINARRLPEAEKLVVGLCQVEGMSSISVSTNKERTNVIMGKEARVLWGLGYITDQIGDIQFRISPLSFYQVNPVQTKRLYETALEYAHLTGEEVVWDLYCGIGTISLFLSRKAKQVYGVEISPRAIEDARENARINRIENVEFYAGKVEELLPKMYEEEGVSADVIVVDPPRKGCDEACLETMIQMQPKRIVYVSCDSATLARDLEVLCGGGYEVTRGRCVDQFCQTVHVETVALLTRKAQ